MIEVKTESWATVDSQIEAVASFHWDELALDKLLFQRDLDHEKYFALEKQGMLHVVTARSHGDLIGYIICFVMPHMHYKSSGLVALADMYYLLREHRLGGLGVRMFREMERGLKERGVIRAHMSCKKHEDHTRLFEAMGWDLTDYTFSKVLCR